MLVATGRAFWSSTQQIDRRAACRQAHVHFCCLLPAACFPLPLPTVLYRCAAAASRGRLSAGARVSEKRVFVVVSNRGRDRRTSLLSPPRHSCTAHPLIFSIMPPAKKAKHSPQPFELRYFPVMAKGLGPALVAEYSGLPWKGREALGFDAGKDWKTLKPTTPFGQVLRSFEQVHTTSGEVAPLLYF